MAAPIRTTLAVSFVLMLATISLAQPPGATDAAGVAIPPAEESVQTTAGGATLKFNFTAADWPSVLTWFAEQAELSLQLDVAPSGSFTYIDPDRAYSINDAMDVPNLSLLKRGYVAVRRGRLLQLIDLEVENADKLISEIAELVPPMMLETRGKSDVVSTVFPLGGMTPAAAKEELAQLIGPWGRVIVLESAGQVKVTETAEKLMGIRDVLESTASAQTTVTVITLQHRAAEEILEIARPLLGLEAGMMSNDDIRIALSLLGDKMYVTGRPGKVGLLQALVDEADKSLVSETVTDEAAVTPKFKTHAVSTADPTTVFDVLQTLLAGTPDARITIEPNTQSIIAFARPETHALITDTIAEMEGQQKTLRVFTLKRLDPAQALLTINKFFGVDAEGNGRGPTIDGNPEDGKLWVRGTERQIELVDTLLQELEGQDSIAGLAGKVRMLPIGGKPDTREAIERAIQLWPITGRKNGIRQMPSRGDDTPRQQVIPERRSRDDLSASRRVHPHSGVTATRLIQTPVDDTIPTSLNLSDDIVIQFTPGGLMIASEDLEALDEFQLLVESLTADDLPSDVPTIFWLKYAEAEPTAELISSILGGSQSSVGSVVDSATSGMGGGMLGGLLGLAGGGDDESPAKSVLTAAGSVSIVPDARLNALIIQAGAADIALIEMLIEKIDIADSPEDIQVKAKPAIIPVIYQNAQDVATVVKEALGDRIEGAEKSNSRGGGGRGGSPDPADFIAALRGGGGGRKADAEKTKSEANKINIAVDKKANALIVVASPQDFEEVRDLVATLDEAGADLEETIETVTVGGNINPEVMKAALSSILGPNVTTTTAGKTDGKTAAATPGSNSSGSTSSSDSDTQNAADIQRRMEFFRALRSGGGGGGAPGGGGGGRGGGGGFGGERGGDRGGRGGGN